MRVPQEIVLCRYAIAFLFGSAAALAGPLEDAATVGEHPVWKHELLNLGSIGARGSMEQETRYPLAGYYLGDQIEVHHIFKDGPANGRLRVGDKITGVEGRKFGTEKFTPTVPDFHAKQKPEIMAEGKFRVQAYRELGHAIDVAEKSGTIGLDVLRDGKPTQVSIPLRRLGTYAPFGPGGDKKSDKILANACKFLVKHQGKDGRWLGHVEPSGPAITTALCGLTLLASNDDQYLPHVKRAVTGMLDALFSPPGNAPLYKMGLQNWHVTYACILVSEYQLRTGDTSEKDRLQILCDYLLSMQLVTAEHGLGGWGHGENPLNPGPHPSASYRELNICGAQNVIALNLMQRCGLKVPEANLQAALRYLDRAAGDTGAVDYSHWAISSGKGSSPGATGASLVGFKLCQYAPSARAKMTTWLSQNLLNAPHNHGSVLVGVMWTGLGLSMNSSDEYRRAMQEFRWYFTLARGHDGSFTSIPGHEANVFKVSADRSLGRYWCTGASALVLAAPKRTLYITGKAFSDSR